MNPKGSINIAVIIVILLVLGGVGYFALTRNSDNKSDVLPQGVIVGNEDQTTTPLKTDVTVSSKGKAWGCRFVTQGTAPRPEDPQVCGYIPTCSVREFLFVGLGEGTWSDGSLKGTFTCSSGAPPPSTAQ